MNCGRNVHNCSIQSETFESIRVRGKNHSQVKNKNKLIFLFLSLSLRFLRRLFCRSFRPADSQKIIENGIITQIRAEWILPEDKKLDVTLKILNSEKHLTVSTSKKICRQFHEIQRKFVLIHWIGVFAFGGEMEQFVFTGAGQNVRIHIDVTVHTCDGIDAARITWWISSTPTSTCVGEEFNWSISYPGPCASLFARKQHNSWSHSMCITACSSLRWRQFGGAIGRSGFPEIIHKWWVSDFGVFLVEFTNNNNGNFIFELAFLGFRSSIIRIWNKPN